MSRGLINKNPGNIRNNHILFRGEVRPSKDKAFKQFESMVYGYRAIFKILKYYSNHYKINTIKWMISRWAPPYDGDNDTEAYIQFVCDKVGIGPNDLVDVDNKDMMVKFVSAISKVENGVDADMDIIRESWDLV